MTREFIILPSFSLKWKGLGLDDNDMRRLENELLADPQLGDIMSGTGGVRKMWFAFENRGKSGSVRVIYIDFEVYEKIFFINVFQKSDKSNLTSGEKNEVKKLVKLLELSLEGDD